MTATKVSAFHVSGMSKAKGKGNKFIKDHKSVLSSGIFTIDMDIHFDPAINEFPKGTLTIQTNTPNGDKNIFIASTIELINSYGRLNPTIYLTGICKAQNNHSISLEGCRYWLMVVNKITNHPNSLDIVGFCIHDSNGNRLAHGTNV